MLNRYNYIVFFLLSCVTASFSQITKGDAFYNQGQYIEAITFYKKEYRSKKSTQKQEALIKLGNSYKFINDYVSAEDSYSKAVALDSTVISAETYYNYAQVLKTNGKYQEAALQLSHYIDLTPNDENAKKTLKFINEIKYYINKPKEYDVKNIESINTDKAEFCPMMIGNKLIFVAEKESFDFVNYEVNDYDGQPFIHMYVSNIDGGRVKKSKSLSKKVNSDYHDGPGCISTDGHTLYFTRVSNVEKKGFVNYSKIYIATGGERTWKDVKVMDISSDEYSVAHPSISHDNTTLYFVSNMPGGFGGKDIWYSVHDTSAKTWSKPVNLGPDVNTSGDEMFPSIRKDGILFFSSNGLPGYGGLDIYSAKMVDSKWLLERNEGLELNSSSDDFGITFQNDSIGYFSSNRLGGKGKDDIYSFRYTDKSLLVSGTVLLSENVKDYAKSKKVLLMDENGNVVDSTKTDEHGYFVFKNLPGDKKYMAVIEEDNIDLKSNKYYLTGGAGNDSLAKRVTVKLANGKFAFKNLPLDPNAMPDLNGEENTAFTGKLFAGEGSKTPVKNVKLKIVNQKGEVVEEVMTDENGTFTFKNIPSDPNYLITIDEGDVKLSEGTKITLTNKAGKEVKSFYKTKDSFAFKILPSEKSTLANVPEEEDISFAGTLRSGDKSDKVLKNVKVKIMNQKGEVIGETTTDENGAFAFRNIPGDENFIVAIDEGDVSLPEGSKITMTNKAGKEVKSFYKNKDEFTFKVLSSEKDLIKEMDIEDIDMAMGLYGILYDQDKKPIANANIKIKDENGANERKIKTGPTGKFNFNNLSADQNYIFEIDESDPSLQGVSRISIADSKGRIYKVVEMLGGKFAFKILESDKNAMGEFVMDDPKLVAIKRKKAEEKKKEVVMGLTGFIYDQDKKPIENARVKVKDLNGANEHEAHSIKGGMFRFDNLNADKNYLFELDENDPALSGITRVSIADGNGKVYKIVELSGGKFAFKILTADKNVMGEFTGTDPMLIARRKKAQEKEKQKLALKEEPKEPVKEPLKMEEPIVVVEEEPEEEEEVEASITIVENIYYAYGSFSVTPDGEIILNKAADALLEYPKLVLEISAHTDAQSSSGFNLGLSRRRAQAAVDYMVNKGVERKRLKATGYGEARLLNKCSDGVICSDEEHKINRRTEFKITKPIKAKPKPTTKNKK